MSKSCNIYICLKVVIYICQPVWTQKACHQSLFPGKAPSTQPDHHDDHDHADDDHDGDSNDDDDCKNSWNCKWIREVFKKSWSKIQENPKPPSNLPVLVSK